MRKQIVICLLILCFSSLLFCGQNQGNNQTGEGGESIPDYVIAKQNLSEFLVYFADQQFEKAVNSIDPSYFQNLVDEYNQRLEEMEDGESVPMAPEEIKDQFYNALKNHPIKLKSFSIEDNPVREGDTLIYTVHQVVDDAMGEAVATENFIMELNNEGNWVFSLENFTN
jgi:hypothetical protein